MIVTILALSKTVGTKRKLLINIKIQLKESLEFSEIFFDEISKIFLLFRLLEKKNSLKNLKLNFKNIIFISKK